MRAGARQQTCGRVISCFCTRRASRTVEVTCAAGSSPGGSCRSQGTEMAPGVGVDGQVRGLSIPPATSAGRGREGRAFRAVPGQNADGGLKHLDEPTFRALLERAARLNPGPGCVRRAAASPSAWTQVAPWSRSTPIPTLRSSITLTSAPWLTRARFPERSRTAIDQQLSCPGGPAPEPGRLSSRRYRSSRPRPRPRSACGLPSLDGEVPTVAPAAGRPRLPVLGRRQTLARR